jgi:putative spermidine/putrescine transport system substrate-binding protein
MEAATLAGYSTFMTWSHYLLRFIALLLISVLPAFADAGETLRVLTWPGYADADLVKVFEQRTGSKVEVTLIDNDEALWQKVSPNKGRDFDVFAVNTAELQRYIAQSLVVPIATDEMHNLSTQLPEFRNLKAIPGVVHGGKAFAIPYTYAEMGLIFDRKQIKEAPTSIRVLWDPRYQGKVLLYNGGSHSFTLAAQSLGHETPFQLAASDWSASVRQLIALRRNALTFYTQPEESVELFQKQGAALMFANYGSQQVELLKKGGLDVGYAIPQEGALAWLDCWVITPGAKNKALAQAWIDYLLEPAPSAALVDRQGLANTTTRSPARNARDRLIWLEPVEDVARRTLLWERIVSGDRISRVLAP